MLITAQMIWDELQRLNSLLHKNSLQKITEDLQEFSLNETAKLLRMSTETLRLKAEKGEIPSLVEDRSNAKDGVTFKFLAQHIRQYQERRRFKSFGPNKEVAKLNIDKMIDDALNR